MFCKDKIVLKNMYFINTNSLNIFIFFYPVFHAKLIVNLPGAFYSEHILTRHRRADSSLFHRPLRNNFFRRDLWCVICGRAYVFSYLYFNKNLKKYDLKYQTKYMKICRV